MKKLLIRKSQDLRQIQLTVKKNGLLMFLECRQKPMFLSISNIFHGSNCELIWSLLCLCGQLGEGQGEAGQLGDV